MDDLTPSSRERPDIGAGGASTHPARGLLDLPQEMQDHIFDLAYPYIGRRLKLVTKTVWNFVETSNKRINRSYKRKPFPTLKVDEILVSKLYFLAAARAWVGNQVLKETPYSAGIITAFTKTVIPDRRFGIRSPLGASVFKLLKLTVSADDMIDNVDQEFMPWEIELANDSLMATPLYKTFSKFRGIQQLELVAGDIREEGMLPAPWKLNVQKLQSLLQLQVSQPRTWSTNDAQLDFWANEGYAPLRLYLSSDVSYDRSRLTSHYMSDGQKMEIPDWHVYGDKTVKVLDDMSSDHKAAAPNEESPGDQKVSQGPLDRNLKGLIAALMARARSNPSSKSSDDDELPVSDEDALEVLLTNPSKILASLRGRKRTFDEL